MLEYNYKQQRLPIGGHQFNENGHTLTGETFDEVVKKLEDYRITNRIAIGNPKNDVILFYAKNWPWMVISSPGGVETNCDHIEYRSWMNEVWESPPPRLISSKEASVRWDACKDCPFNVDRKFSPSRELDELKKRAFLLRKGQRVPEYLKNCSLHHDADLSVLTFIEIADKYAKQNRAETKPANCWIK